MFGRRLNCKCKRNKMTTTLLMESLQSRTSANSSIIKKKKPLVEGEVLVAANGSSNVSEYINLTCFSIIRITKKC